LRISYLGGILAAALCFGANLAVAGAPEVKLSANYVGMSVDVKTVRGVVFVIADAREISGKVAVCGLVFFEKPTATLKVMESQITKKLDFSLAGTKLIVNTSVFKRFDTEADATAGNARCWVSTTAWKASFGKAKLAMNLPRGTVSE
jgi:hypothetical protein